MVDSSDAETKSVVAGGRVRVVVGDITRQKVAAIVNAANSSLLGGGGVDGAIHRAGGRAILEACRELRSTLYPEGLPTGEAVLTTAGELPARYVIHTVGPVWGAAGGCEAELLAACYRNSLALAAERGLETVAFPAISTGVYGYPREEAARVASRAVADFLARPNAAPSEVRFVFFSDEDAEVFLRNHGFEE
ncbi:MAG TPA: O-acetyl-ADP-ribose deacetylase [Pyrinomonadaceae bacterium]|nr:O-acetyl-ADP-ribose deacetylase [Pyrinomonadaceae bacterium]